MRIIKKKRENAQLSLEKIVPGECFNFADIRDLHIIEKDRFEQSNHVDDVLFMLLDSSRKNAAHVPDGILRIVDLDSGFIYCVAEDLAVTFRKDPAIVEYYKEENK